MESLLRNGRLLLTSWLVLNPEKFQQYECVVSIYLTLLLVFIGIGVNVAAAYQLGRDDTLRQLNRFMLRALSITDVIFLVTCVTSDVIPTIVSSTLWVADTRFERMWNSLGNYLWPAKHVAIVASTWLIVAITFDQYSTTTIGMSRSLLCGTSTRKRLTGDLAVYIAWIGSVIFNLPRFFYLNGAVYVFFYDLVGYVFVAILLPGVIIVCLARRLVDRVRRSSQPTPSAADDDDKASRSLDASHGESATGSRERRATMTVLGIVGAMFVCRVPGIVAYVYGFPFRLELSWSGSYEEEYRAFEYFLVFTNLLLVINSSTRFVDYLVFRRSCMDCSQPDFI